MYKTDIFIVVEIPSGYTINAYQEEETAKKFCEFLRGKRNWWGRLTNSPDYRVLRKNLWYTKEICWRARCLSVA